MFVSLAWLDGGQGKGRQMVIESYVEAWGHGLPPGLQRVMLLENDHGWLVVKFFDSEWDSAADQYSYEKRTETQSRGGTRLRGLDEWEVVFDTAS